MESSVGVSAMQRQKYNLFDSSDSDRNEESVAAQKNKNKKKVMFDSSDS